MKANYLHLTVNFKCEHCGQTSTMYIKHVEDDIFSEVVEDELERRINVYAYVRCPECGVLDCIGVYHNEEVKGG